MRTRASRAARWAGLLCGLALLAAGCISRVPYEPRADVEDSAGPADVSDDAAQDGAAAADTDEDLTEVAGPHGD